MRRGVTALVVVVVAAIALAAGVDALRGDGEREPAAQPAPEQPPASTAAEAPEAPPVAAGPDAGVLYYTDDVCQLEAAELPDLAQAEAPNWDECEFVLSPDALRVAGAGSGWDPHSDPRRGRLYESADGLIQVSTNGGPEGDPFRGEAPAWRPDGTLTYFAGGAVRDWPSRRVVFSHAELIRAAMTSFNAPGDPRLIGRIRVRDLAWLDQEHAVLTIQAF